VVYVVLVAQAAWIWSGVWTLEPEAYNGAWSGSVWSWGLGAVHSRSCVLRTYYALNASSVSSSDADPCTPRGVCGHHCLGTGSQRQRTHETCTCPHRHLCGMQALLYMSYLVDISSYLFSFFLSFNILC